MARRHAPLLQYFVDVELLIDADGACEWAVVIFDNCTYQLTGPSDVILRRVLQ